MKALNKLRSRRGESLVEILISLVVSSLGILMLAGVIATSTRIIKNNSLLMDQYYRRNNVLETRADDAVSGDGVTVESGAAIKITPEGKASVHYTVKYYVHEQNGEYIVSYKKVS
jgi:type II secretory pathway component PulJ